MDRLPSEMNLPSLAKRSSEEMNKYRRREPSDDRYCLEIFRRAATQGSEEAWEVLYGQFVTNLRVWFRRHPSKELVLQYAEEDYYINDAFQRFWKAVTRRDSSFTTLASTLSYLHLCLNCAVMDTLRDFAHPKETPLPDYGQVDEPEPLVEDLYHEDELWEIIESLLANSREKRVAFLHFHCNLKPREIMRFCPGEFSSEGEIYRLKRNVIERLMRNKDKFQWKLGG